MEGARGDFVPAASGRVEVIGCGLGVGVVVLHGDLPVLGRPSPMSHTPDRSAVVMFILFKKLTKKLEP